MNEKNLEGVHYESDTHDKSPTKGEKKSEKKNKETEGSPAKSFAEAIDENKTAEAKKLALNNSASKVSSTFITIYTTKSADPFDRGELMRKLKANKSKARVDTPQICDDPPQSHSHHHPPRDASESADILMSPSSNAKLGQTHGSNLNNNHSVHTFSFHTNFVECEATREANQPLGVKDPTQSSKRPMIDPGSDSGGPLRYNTTGAPKTKQLKGSRSLKMSLKNRMSEKHVPNKLDDNINGSGLAAKIKSAIGRFFLNVSCFRVTLLFQTFEKSASSSSDHSHIKPSKVRFPSIVENVDSGDDDDEDEDEDDSKTHSSMADEEAIDPIEREKKKKRRLTKVTSKLLGFYQQETEPSRPNTPDDIVSSSRIRSNSNKKMGVKSFVIKELVNSSHNSEDKSSIDNIQQVDIMQDSMDPFQSMMPRERIQSNKESNDPDDVNELGAFTRMIRKLDIREQERLIIRKLGIIRQNNPFRVRWDLFVMILSVWNSVIIPIELAFKPPSFEARQLIIANFTIDFIFVLDILLNFRTSFFNPNTADEILNPKKIAMHYVTSSRFWIDVLSTIPFDVIMELFQGAESSSGSYQLLSMLKLFRVLRLSRIINYMNSTDEVKLSLKLFQLCMFLVLYIHCTACLLYGIASTDMKWLPSQMNYYSFTKTIYEQDTHVKYVLSFYNSILMLTGNDIYPSGFIQYILCSFCLISGALINANIFGTIAVIAQTFNRKAQRFQEQIDVANTSMKNMKLPDTLQENIREFMMSTQSNLDNQKELDQFLTMISPSLRMQVTQHIFLRAISKNNIFKDNEDLIDFLINDISTLLFLPEDTVVQQGQTGESLLLIAKGDCEVWVKDHLKQNRYVRQLFQGEYFGELALLTQGPRTATVKSSNYCTLASLKKQVFYDLCQSFPDVFIKMKKKALEYNDPWKQFKMKVLQQIDYFEVPECDHEFFDEAQYFLEEEFFEKGTEIIATGEPCNSIIFIVHGQLELRIYDEDGNSTVLDTLQQGDIIGQYSVLANEGFMFTATANTNVRLLTLDSSFFNEQQESIDGLGEAIKMAQQYISEQGIPLCDYKIFKSEREKVTKKFLKVVQRAKAINSLRLRQQAKFREVVQSAQAIKDVTKSTLIQQRRKTIAFSPGREHEMPYQDKPVLKKPKMQTPREELRGASFSVEDIKRREKKAKKSRPKVNDIMSSNSKNALSSDLKSSFSGSHILRPEDRMDRLQQPLAGLGISMPQLQNQSGGPPRMIMENLGLALKKSCAVQKAKKQLRQMTGVFDKESRFQRISIKKPPSALAQSFTHLLGRQNDESRQPPKKRKSRDSESFNKMFENQSDSASETSSEQIEQVTRVEILKEPRSKKPPSIQQTPLTVSKQKSSSQATSNKPVLEIIEVEEDSKSSTSSLHKFHPTSYQEETKSEGLLSSQEEGFQFTDRMERNQKVLSQRSDKRQKKPRKIKTKKSQFQQSQDVNNNEGEECSQSEDKIQQLNLTSYSDGSSFKEQQQEAVNSVGMWTSWPASIGPQLYSPTSNGPGGGGQSRASPAKNLTQDEGMKSGRPIDQTGSTPQEAGGPKSSSNASMGTSSMAAMNAVVANVAAAKLPTTNFASGEGQPQKRQFGMNRAFVRKMTKKMTKR